MSISDAVDTRYRLLPADLGGRARRVLVYRVSVEGVEQMTPLVHFEGVARPLALDGDQRSQMAQIAGSTLLADWVGVALVLRPERRNGQTAIALYGLETHKGWAARTVRIEGWRPRTLRLSPTLLRRVLRLLLLLALTGAFFAAASLLEQTPYLDALWSVFRN